MSALWGPAKQTSKMGYFTFTGGARVFVRVELHAALREVDRIFVEYGYKVRAVDTGGYNPRYIAGTSVWSLHAFGIAIDFNWLLNPAGGHLVTNMPRAMVEEIEAIVTNAGVRVFRWGGDWNDNELQDETFYDAMHFEAQASPAELAAGIRATPTIDPEAPELNDAERLLLKQAADDARDAKELARFAVLHLEANDAALAEANRSPSIVGQIRRLIGDDATATTIRARLKEATLGVRELLKRTA